MPAMSSIVRMDAVNKRYSNGTVALREMTLSIERREFVSLLGPSGCGKSTALRMMAGLLSLSSGSIEWPVIGSDSSERQRDISFVFQEPTLMPWSSIFDNVYLLTTSRRR